MFIKTRYIVHSRKQNYSIIFYYTLYKAYTYAACQEYQCVM